MKKGQKRQKNLLFCHVTLRWRHCAKMATVTSYVFPGIESPLPGVPAGSIGLGRYDAEQVENSP